MRERKGGGGEEGKGEREEGSREEEGREGKRRKRGFTVPGRTHGPTASVDVG